MGYVALHNHSFYSLLDSAMAVEEIVDTAVQYGMPAVGLTDRDTLAGAVQFYKKAKAAGVHPVIGSQVTIEGGGSLVLLIESAEGYRNLCRLLSTRIEHPARVTPDDLNLYRGGLICLSATASPEHREIFGPNFALTVSPQSKENLRVGRRLRIPLVATAEAHYRAADDRLCYDILASMRTLTMLKQAHPEKHGEGNYHLHSPQEIKQCFQSIQQVIDNTERIAERCRFDFELGDILFPPFAAGEGQTPAGMLRRMAREGVERRYAPRPKSEVYVRLERELGVIEEVGYAEYFLIFADIVRWANQHGIETLARGSAAGSLVCYALGISNVCPFRFGLSFERFLNRERMQFAKLADIDLDLPWDRRARFVESGPKQERSHTVGTKGG